MASYPLVVPFCHSLYICHVCSLSGLWVTRRTPVTIVTRTCASSDSPGLHHFPDYLPYICHSLWFHPQALLCQFCVSSVYCSCLLFCIMLCLFIKTLTPWTCILTLSAHHYNDIPKENNVPFTPYIFPFHGPIHTLIKRISLVISTASDPTDSLNTNALLVNDVCVL